MRQAQRSVVFEKVFKKANSPSLYPDTTPATLPFYFADSFGCESTALRLSGIISDFSSVDVTQYEV